MSLEQLGKNAESGTLVLHLEDSAIENIIAACGDYTQALTHLKQEAQALSTFPLGFAEGHLGSGAKLAQAFQEKAAGAVTSAEATFQSHIDQVEEMKTLFAALRRGYASTEANNANSFGRPGS